MSRYIIEVKHRHTYENIFCAQNYDEVLYWLRSNNLSQKDVYINYIKPKYYETEECRIIKNRNKAIDDILKDCDDQNE